MFMSLTFSKCIFWHGRTKQTQKFSDALSLLYMEIQYKSHFVCRLIQTAARKTKIGDFQTEAREAQRNREMLQKDP